MRDLTGVSSVYRLFLLVHSRSLEQEYSPCPRFRVSYPMQQYQTATCGKQIHKNSVLLAETTPRIVEVKLKTK